MVVQRGGEAFSGAKPLFNRDPEGTLSTFSGQGPPPSASFSAMLFKRGGDAFSGAKSCQ